MGPMPILSQTLGRLLLSRIACSSVFVAPVCLYALERLADGEAVRVFRAASYGFTPYDLCTLSGGHAFGLSASTNPQVLPCRACKPAVGLPWEAPAGMHMTPHAVARAC
jgi:hypothetical protein